MDGNKKSTIYDCFLFNDELDILRLRLDYMSKYVDYMVIAESSQTFSGLDKPYYYELNKQLYAEYKDKIIHVMIPCIEETNNWNMEFYQRNYIKTALNDCAADDLIIISDVDEFINMDYLLTEYKISRPCLITMQAYYYFLNLKKTELWRKTLVSPYSYIKEIAIGDRLKYYLLRPMLLNGNEDRQPLGWHFGYLFGYDTQLYISKLKSFAHQEYNTAYFLDAKRIATCIGLKIDLLERDFSYKAMDLATEISPQLYQSLIRTNLKEKLTYQYPGVKFFFSVYTLKYFIKFKFKKPRKPVTLKF